MITREEFQEVKALYAGLMIAFFVGAVLVEFTNSTIPLGASGLIAMVLIFITIHKEKQMFGTVVAKNPLEKKPEEPEDETKD